MRYASGTACVGLGFGSRAVINVLWVGASCTRQLVNAATPAQASAVLTSYRETLSDLNVALTAHATVSDAQVRAARMLTMPSHAQPTPKPLLARLAADAGTQGRWP